MNKQLALAIELNDEATFANFSWGNNHLLAQQLKQSLLQQGERFFYLWGQPGSGKSHLLQACCQAMKAESIYLPLQLLQDLSPDCLEGLNSQKLIAIDDLEVISGQRAWEEAIFHLYNQLRDQGSGLLIISSRKPLAALALQLADLHSRLGWGLVVELQELNDELKIEALQRQAKARGFVLSAQIAEFLIRRSGRNMHQLQGLIAQLDKASLIAQRKITLPFVKTILKL